MAASTVRRVSDKARENQELAKHLAGLISTFRIDDRDVPAAQPRYKKPVENVEE